MSHHVVPYVLTGIAEIFPCQTWHCTAWHDNSHFYWKCTQSGPWCLPQRSPTCLWPTVIPIVSLETGVTSLSCICVFITSYRSLCSWHSGEWASYVYPSSRPFSQIYPVTRIGVGWDWVHWYCFLAYYAWPRTYPSRSCKINPWREHVHRATRQRSQAIDMAWRHVALATTRITCRHVAMAQEIVSRLKHNMLSLLYGTCLKLLVFL